MRTVEYVKKSWVLLLGVFAVGFALGSVVQFGGAPAIPGTYSETGTPGSETAGTPEGGGASPEGTQSPSSPGVKPLVVSGLTILTPAAGDRWQIGSRRDIVWNKESGAAGAIVLIDSKTKKQIGWVLPSLTPKQVSFQWDTRDVSITRVGGTRTNVAAGDYALKIMFDDGRPATLSNTFQLSATGGEIITQAVRLKNVSVTPSVLTVKRGTRVVFVNNDAKKQIISPPSGQTTFPPFTVPASGGAYSFDTAPLAPGTYNYRSDIYSYQAPGTLIVE